MMKLGMRHLVVLDELFKTGSVSETARILGLTQSAVSHRMREAEKRLNTKLFQKSGRQIGFTGAAERLLLAARDVLDEMERVQEDLEKISSGYDDVVRLGGAYYTPFDWLPRVQKALSEPTKPRIALEIPSRLFDDPVREVKTAAIDVAIVLGAVDDPELAVHHLQDDDLVAVAALNHPWATKTMIEPQDFATETHVTNHTRPERGRESEIIFARHRVLPRTVISAGLTDAVLALVSQGQGVTILPRRMLDHEYNRWPVILRPIAVEDTRVAWNLVSSRRDAARPSVQYVTDLIKASFLHKERLVQIGELPLS